MQRDVRYKINIKTKTKPNKNKKQHKTNQNKQIIYLCSWYNRRYNYDHTVLSTKVPLRTEEIKINTQKEKGSLQTEK